MKVTHDMHGPLFDLDAAMKRLDDAWPVAIPVQSRGALAKELLAALDLGIARGKAAGAEQERERCKAIVSDHAKRADVKDWSCVNAMIDICSDRAVQKSDTPAANPPATTVAETERIKIKSVTIDVADDADAFLHVPAEVIDAELRKHGVDPVALAKRGLDFVNKVKAEQPAPAPAEQRCEDCGASLAGDSPSAYRCNPCWAKALERDGIKLPKGCDCCGFHHGEHADDCCRDPENGPCAKCKGAPGLTAALTAADLDAIEARAKKHLSDGQDRAFGGLSWNGIVQEALNQCGHIVRLVTAYRALQAERDIYERSAKHWERAHTKNEQAEVERDEARAEVERLQAECERLRNRPGAEGRALQAECAQWKGQAEARTVELKRQQNFSELTERLMYEARQDRDEARAEVAKLQAECLRLHHAEAEAMALVLSHEGRIAKLDNENERLKEALTKIRDAAIDCADTDQSPCQCCRQDLRIARRALRGDQK